MKTLMKWLGYSVLEYRGQVVGYVRDYGKSYEVLSGIPFIQLMRPKEMPMASGRTVQWIRPEALDILRKNL